MSWRFPHSVAVQAAFGLTLAIVLAGCGICFGDSGGPTMIKVNGEWVLAGINSGFRVSDVPAQTDPCAYSGQMVKIHPFKSWIEEAKKRLEPTVGELLFGPLGGTRPF